MELAKLSRARAKADSCYLYVVRVRGESFSARPISEGLARSLLQGLRETERELEQRLDRSDEGLEAIRELRAALEQGLKVK
jgi:hypothetical protein